jgi:glycosyltransferase involved in cell wall biosynthesis
VRLQAYTRAVRAQGFDVTVVTRFPFAERRRGRGLRRWVLVETVNGCRVRRLRLPAEDLLESGLDLFLRGIARATSTARILGKEAIDFLFACLAVPWVLTQRPQVIVVEQGPVWLALPLRVCARAGTAVVLQISDVKSAAMARGRYGPVPADSIDLNARLETRVWRSATRLVTVTERLRAIIAARSRLPTSAVDLIPNGVELDCVAPTSAESRERCKRALGLGGRFVAIYAGTLGSAHDLETVVQAAVLLGGDPAGRHISLLIIGEGPRRRALTQLIPALGAANVRLLRGVPLEALGPFLGAADVGLSTEWRGLSDTLRAKLFLYMGARLPILATDDGGEVRELMDRSGAGLLVEPENAAALAAAIIRLQRDPASAERYAHNARRYAEAHHDRRVLAAHLARVVAEAAAGAEGRRAPSYARSRVQ